MAKILIADDEVAVTTQMEERLANMGYDVTESASSGDESVDLARRFHPDAILMDIVMPGRMDGISAARKIREEMDIPVIFLTAYADDNTVRRAIKTNPYGYIVKPFHEKGVKAAIEVALYKKKWEQSLAAANKKLKKGEQMLRLIATNMNDLVFMTDLNGNIQYATPSLKDILGYETEERIGRPSFELVHPEDIENLKTIFANAIATSTPAKARYRLKHADGHYVWVEAAGNFIFDDDGQAVGAILNIRDITDRKQAEEEIKNHQEHLALINQILRHDLTNDLVVIQSALNLYNKTPEEEYLKEISTRTERCLELIGQMRELETFISRHKELKVFEIRDAIDEVKKSYSSVKFKIKGKARVMADESLNSVIDNIIRNAVNHGKADRITITTGKERDLCEVRIADNGTGIPDEIKEKVFEEGFIHGDTGHTGLGLHIVEKAMKSYGGYTWVEDNEPKGAVIILRFKMVK